MFLLGVIVSRAGKARARPYFYPYISASATWKASNSLRAFGMARMQAWEGGMLVAAKACMPSGVPCHVAPGPTAWCPDDDRADAAAR